LVSSAKWPASKNRAEAEALADWIALHNRNLETIYITHAHFDQMTALYPDWVANQSWLMFGFPGA
jgi:glyoxylase-like metal-dependent hydrolase (beta-lactamase superfamily II)